MLLLMLLVLMLLLLSIILGLGHLLLVIVGEELLLFSTLSNPPIAKGNQLGGILFDAGADSFRKLLQSLWIGPVLGRKMLNAHGGVLGEFIVLLILIAAALLLLMLVMHGRCRKVHLAGGTLYNN